jgi:hypothetical protein
MRFPAGIAVAHLLAVTLAIGGVERVAAQPAVPITTLPVADSAALRVCELVPLGAIGAADAEGRIALTADSSWFIMEQEKNTPDEAYMSSVKERLRSDLEGPDVSSIMASAETLAPLCAERWPVSQRSYQIVLPGAQFDRAGVCGMTAAMLSGMARKGNATVTAEAAQRIMAEVKPILSKEALIAHGFRILPGSTAIGANWLKSAHCLGNLNSIFAACIRPKPAG